MNCPFCGSEMAFGQIQPTGGNAPFWLPAKVRKRLFGRYFTARALERNGGRTLGITTNIGLLYGKAADSYLCKNCRVVITPLDLRENLERST